MSTNKQKEAFLKQNNMVAGIGKPNSFPKNAFIAGTILSFGKTLVKNKNTDFFTVKESASGEVKSFWMDKGLLTVFQQNGIMTLLDDGSFVVKNNGLIAIENLGLRAIDTPEGKRSVNAYELHLQK